MSFEYILGKQDWKTVSDGLPTTFKVSNSTDLGLSLYWYDRSGQTILYRTLQPGQSHIQPTATEHPWYVSSTDGSIEYSFYPSEVGTVDIKSDGLAFKEFAVGDFILWHIKRFDFSPSSEEQFLSATDSASIFSTYYGYGVPDAAEALGVKKTGSKFFESSKNNHEALNYLYIRDAWDAGYTGKGVKIAVLDVGFHENVEFAYIDKWNLMDGDDTLPFPESQTHGNLVASVIFSRFDSEKYTAQSAVEYDTTGVAPDAELFAFATSNTSGGTDVTVADGIRLAVERGINIVHISQGRLDTAPPIVQSAVDYAYENNVLVVFAGGNNSNFGPDNLASTALSGKAIGVGNLRLDVTEPFKSSNLAGGKIFPYFFAPSSGTYVSKGSDYLSTLDAGTSTSSPYITGIAALLYQKNPNITVDEVIELLALSAWQPSLGKNAEINNLGEQLLTPQNISSALLNSPAIDVLQFDSTASDSISSPSQLSKRNGVTTTDGEVLPLDGVERLKFTDSKIAFDTDGNAGDALQLLYAVSKDQYLNNDGVKGLAIELIDKAADRNEIVDYVMGVLAGPFWDLDDISSVLAKNVYGLDLTAATENLITDLMEANEWDVYDFFWAIAESETVSSAIGLVGLSDSGITYS